MENLYKDIEKTIVSSNKEIEDTLEKMKQSLKEQVVNAKLGEKKSTKFYFSPSFKHAQVNLITPTIAKSIGSTSSYRFAILEPALSLHKTTKFAFKIKQATANSWLALGLCHKNIIVQKNYGFQFSSVGNYPKQQC